MCERLKINVINLYIRYVHNETIDFPIIIATH